MIGIVVIIAIALVWFFFSRNHASSLVSQPSSTTGTSTTSTPQVTQPGQYPVGFPQEVVIYPNLTPISGGTLVDAQGNTHLIVEFLPGISIAKMFSDYKAKLPSLGWTVINSGSSGTSTANINFYLEATKGTETLGMSASNSNLGAKLRLEVVQ